jgi:predicted RNA-binding Zn ribbon-like protein
MEAPVRRRPAAAKFRFGYGSSALDLAVTLRRRASEPVELLVTAGDAARWLQAARLIDETRPLEDADLRELRELRDAIYRIGYAAVANRAPSTRDLHLLNKMAQRGDAVPQLNEDWSLRTSGADALNAALATLARDAIALFGDSQQRAHLRTCEQDDCAGLFLDRSRGERRRWCSMARCGSRAKVAAFRQRKKEEKA